MIGCIQCTSYTICKRVLFSTSAKNDFIINNLRAQFIGIDMPSVLSKVGIVDSTLLEIVRKFSNRGSHVYLFSPKHANTSEVANTLNIPFQRIIHYKNAGEIKDALLSLKATLGYSIPFVFITNDINNVLTYSGQVINDTSNSSNSLSVSTKLSSDTSDLVFNVLKSDAIPVISSESAVDTNPYVWNVTDYKELLGNI